MSYVAIARAQETGGFFSTLWHVSFNGSTASWALAAAIWGYMDNVVKRFGTLARLNILNFKKGKLNPKP